MKLYFAHDTNGNVTEFFDSEAEALAFAREAVAVAAGNAADDGEWENGADGIYVGLVTHKAVLSPDGDGGHAMSFGPLPQ